MDEIENMTDEEREALQQELLNSAMICPDEYGRPMMVQPVELGGSDGFFPIAVIETKRFGALPPFRQYRRMFFQKCGHPKCAGQFDFSLN
jgi:hypothetical protein